jgi:hypothetical protein
MSAACLVLSITSILVPPSSLCMNLHFSGCAAGNLGPQQQKHSQLSNGHGDFPTAMASLQHLWLFVV